MDPLHKTDSAISVASKDHIIYEGQPNPPQAEDTDKSSFISNDGDAFDSGPSSSLPPLIQGQAHSIHGSAASSVSQSTTPTLSSKPSASVSANTNAMENLVPPSEVPQDNSRPPFVSQPASPWNQTSLSHSSHVSVGVGAANPYPGLYQQSSFDDDIPGASSTTDSGSGADALIQAGTGHIDVDHDQLELESDPGYESDRASLASTSLSNSVRDYLYENGRRYHRFREGRYNFPNDEAEQDREDLKHVCVKLLCQENLYFAPLDKDNLQNIMDIGTGTGAWAIEMGDQFPSAKVIGIDLSPIQPDWVPVNVHFLVDDAESPWVYPKDHFDYIHTRHTVMAIKDWPKLYRTALE